MVRVEMALDYGIHFEKTLTASQAPRRFNQGCALTLPQWFVEQHGGKFGQSIVLRYEWSPKPWAVRLNVSIRRRHNLSAEVKFISGWKEFATFHALKKGDLVIFSLAPKRSIGLNSEFRVFVFRGTGQLKSPPPPPPRKRTSPRLSGCRDYEDLRDKGAMGLSGSRKSKKRPVASLPDQFVDLSHGTGSDKPEIEFDGWFVKKRTEEKPEEIIVADSASNPTEYSPPPCSSDMDSHFFEPQDDGEHDQSQNSPPCLLKRVTAYRMEIPCRFMKTHFTGIETRVELQGIHEGSPVQNVDCTFYIDKGRLRLFLTTGWTDFVNGNFLRIGQRLAFILTSKCFFVVRNA